MNYSRSIIRSGLLWLAFLLLAPVSLCAQGESGVWYFGQHAGIDFRNGAAQPLTDGAMDQLEGCSTICDKAGKLLFYTDGISVWNARHQVMPHGTGLFGHSNSTQSALIVPAPCTNGMYYVFTADAGDYLRDQEPGRALHGVNYSTVDMNADGGLGDVTALNIPLLPNATEKLTAVRMGTSANYWVLMHEWGTSRYLAYLLTDTGISSQLVVSDVGVVHGGSAILSTGYLKASPDGKHLVSVLTSSTAELLDFDATTGKVSNPLVLATDATYGASFSPDNSKLYLPQGETLFQYSLENSSPDSILASRDSIGADKFYALQAAPDGRIYIARWGSFRTEIGPWLAVIEHPNDRGVACGFVLNGFSTQLANGSGGKGSEGLPNIIASFMGGLVIPCGPPVARIGLGDSVLCDGGCVNISDASQNAPSEWSWTFDGGIPGTSSSANPGNVCFSETGEHRIKLVVKNDRGIDSAERTLIVSKGTNARAHLAGPRTVAPGDTLSLNVLLDSFSSGDTIRTFQVALAFNAAVLRFAGATVAGSALRDWKVTVPATIDTGYIVFTLAATNSDFLTPASSQLCTIRFVGILSDSLQTTITPGLVLPGAQCGKVEVESANVALSGCGLNTRRIISDLNQNWLKPVFPNPGKGVRQLEFSIAEPGKVSIGLYDAEGILQKSLFNGVLSSGPHHLDFDPSFLASGHYMLRLQSGQQAAEAPVIIVK